MNYDFIVIGAGLSGLILANELKKAGYSVLVIEKSKSCGGRLATRRLHHSSCDHGLQYFEPKMFEETSLGRQILDQFSSSLKLSAEGSLFSLQGMTDIPKKISAGLDVIYNEKIHQITFEKNTYLVHSESGNIFHSKSVVSTQPWPQFRDLMIASQLTDDVLDDQTVIYSQCLVAFVNSLSLKDKYNSNFNFFDQALKYKNNAYTVVQGHSYWSEKHFHLTDENLKLQFSRDLGVNSTDIIDIKKWRYAQSQNFIEGYFYQNKKYSSIFAVGDYFKYTGIRSVFFSVQHLLNQITNNTEGDNHV